MKLRSCSHLHSFQAIKGGLVTKVLNVCHGKPALKFKAVKDIYETEDTKDFDLISVISRKLKFVDTTVECDRSMDESLDILGGERKAVKSEEETSESSCKDCDGQAGDLDELNLANMTLKQFKDRCKKERKCSRHVDSSKRTKTCSLGGQDHFSSQPKKDEYDILEPLSCWKSRILKKKKIEKRKRRNSVSGSFQNALSIVKFGDFLIDQVVFQYSENFPVPIPIKVEVPEHSYSECKDMITFGLDSSCNCDEQLTCRGMISYEEGTADDNDWESDPLTSLIAIEDLDTSKDCVSETGMTEICSEELETDACGFETQIPTLHSDEPQSSTVNEQSYDNIEHADPKTIIGIQASDEEIKTEGSEVEIVKEGIAELVSQFPELSIVQGVDDEYSAIGQIPKSNSTGTVSPSNDHSPEAEMYHDTKKFPCVHEQSQKTSSNSQVQAPEIRFNFECVEFSERNGSCLTDHDAKNDIFHAETRIISTPARDCSSPLTSNLCLNSQDSFVFVPDHSTTEAKGSHSSLGADAARDGSTEIHFYIDEPVISKRFEGCHQSKLQNHPERLLSTRTTISPTSQKSLREAQECTKLDAEQYYKYARKLCYSKQIENKIGRPEEGNQIKRAEVIFSPDKVVKKPKIHKNGFHQNDKVPRPSRAAQRFSTGCTSIQSCSESAILFSQQQMLDVTSITSKLARELQSMREIVEETLQSKLYPDKCAKFNAEEMKNSVQNATRVEESARRSLSIMARDCNRFCKIMKLAEKGSTTSPNAVRKKRKIVFADEAGGDLCDVKTFEEDIFCMEPKGENIVTVD
ncbi:uncharacterized protein LOC126681720 [Mercurialis annua]|uniref:uncharacterized protein LOC126681720 n=1 Tax=Mercurialis annua TaxID=3986 RepID=UPI00215FC4C4|nr:uncharacterized protein LOC126681720 [Mercurialis annua]